MGDIPPVFRTDSFPNDDSTPPSFFTGLIRRVYQVAVPALSHLSSTLTTPLRSGSFEAEIFPQENIERKLRWDTFFREFNHSPFGLQQQLYFHIFSRVTRYRGEQISLERRFGGSLVYPRLLSLEDHLQTFKTTDSLEPHQKEKLDEAIEQLVFAREAEDKNLGGSRLVHVLREFIPAVIIKGYEDEVRSQIQAMRPGASRIFPTGWMGKKHPLFPFSSKHAILCQVTQEKDGSYRITAFNTGGFMWKHHTEKVMYSGGDQGPSKYYPFIVQGVFDAESIVSFLSTNRTFCGASPELAEESFYTRLKNLREVPENVKESMEEIEEMASLLAASSARKNVEFGSAPPPPTMTPAQRKKLEEGLVEEILKISSDDRVRPYLIDFLKSSPGWALKSLLRDKVGSEWPRDVKEAVKTPLPEPYYSQGAVGNCAHKSLSVWLHRVLGKQLYKQFKVDMVRSDFEALKILVKNGVKDSPSVRIWDTAIEVHKYLTDEILPVIRGFQMIGSETSLINQVEWYLKKRGGLS